MAKIDSPKIGEADFVIVSTFVETTWVISKLKIGKMWINSAVKKLAKVPCNSFPQK